MVKALLFIVTALLAYIIGSFPTSYLITKALKGVDIRQSGSGNAGATNVLRVVGKTPAVITLIVDTLKGFLVVTLLADFSYSFGLEFDLSFFKAFLGLAVVCGHIWPVFLKFKGGKGVATTLGVALGLAPLILIPVVVIWLVIFFLTNYVSLASIIALIAFPIIASVFNTQIYIVLVSIIICSISIYKHHENIRRLFMGEENKTVFKSKN